jgi:hypothetical protein
MKYNQRDIDKRKTGECVRSARQARASAQQLS